MTAAHALANTRKYWRNEIDRLGESESYKHINQSITTSSRSGHIHTWVHSAHNEAVINKLLVIDGYKLETIENGNLKIEW